MALRSYWDVPQKERDEQFSTFEVCYGQLYSVQKEAVKKCPNCGELALHEISCPNKPGLKKLSCRACGTKLESPKSYMNVTYTKLIRIPGTKEYRKEEMVVNPFTKNEDKLPAIFKLIWLIIRAKKGLEPVNLGIFDLSRKKIQISSNYFDRLDLIDQARKEYEFNKKGSPFYLETKEFSKYGSMIITYIKAKGNDDFMGLVNSVSDDFPSSVFETEEEENVGEEKKTTRREFDEGWYSHLDDTLTAIINKFPEQYVDAVHFSVAAKNFRDGKDKSNSIFDQAEKLIPNFSSARGMNLWSKFINCDYSVAKYFEKLRSEAPQPAKPQPIVIDKDEIRDVYAMDPSDFGSEEINWTIADFTAAVKKILDIELPREIVIKLMKEFSCKNNKEE